MEGDMGVVKIRNIEKSGICEGIDVYDNFTIPDEVAEYISRLERAISCCRTEAIREMYPLLNHYDYSRDTLVEDESEQMIRGDRINHAVRAETEEDLVEDFKALTTEQQIMLLYPRVKPSEGIPNIKDFQALATEQLEKSENNIL